MSLRFIPFDVLSIIDQQSYFKKREESYQTRFPLSNSTQLARHDSTSVLFAVLDGNQIFAGYRVTTIGNRQSEVEEIFTDYPYETNAVELGRFWLAAPYRQSGLASNLFGEIVDSVAALNNRAVYIKSSTLLGIIATRFGFERLEISKHHPTLNYRCELFARKEMAHATNAN